MALVLTETVLECESFSDSKSVRALLKKSHLLQRRALTSVDNFGLYMDGDDMGLQSTANISKDSQEMEQILVEFGNGDLIQSDLLQAIKTLETAGEVLSSGDTDPFPLPGFDLNESLEPESDGAEDKIHLMQLRLERRCTLLQRRLRILQARAIGKRVSEEATQSFEKSAKSTKRDGSSRLVGLKTFLKKIETTASLQGYNAAKSVVHPQYFRMGTSSRDDAARASTIGVPTGTLAGLEDTVGALRSHLSVVKHELDSDATASSSGAESNDEAVTYNNPHQQHMPVDKRALWTWQRARASISSRWGWLQVQVQELEYKIRQHTDLYHQVRSSKAPLQFEGEPVGSEGEPVGYEGPLPGAELPDEDPALETCARVRPLKVDKFVKRNLLQMHNLHVGTEKAAKPADIRCSCSAADESCPVCTGRVVSTEPAPPFSTQSPAERLALLDSGYHPVLSDIRDVPPSVHLSALCSRDWFRSRSSRTVRGAHHGHAPSMSHSAQASKPDRGAKKPKLKRGRPPLSRKVVDGEQKTTTQERPRGRPSTESRHSRTNSSFDIDNIVIPQSMAACTKPEILHYKDIITPKWRVVEVTPPLNNGALKHRVTATVVSQDKIIIDDHENVCVDAVRVRHVRAEARERQRYTRKQRSRRAPDLLAAPHESEELKDLPIISINKPNEWPQVSPPATTTDESPPGTETVRPFSPRLFPLSDDMIVEMVSTMADDYPNYISEPSPPPPPLLDDENESSVSTMSPVMFEGDDPNDSEWNPKVDRIKRQNATFRFK